MMLATNKKIKSKEDVVNIVLIYFSRWLIEEYFRCIKQMFKFENFRVRKRCNQCPEFLYYPMHGISDTYLYEIRNTCPKGCDHMEKFTLQFPNTASAHDFDENNPDERKHSLLLKSITITE